MKICSLVPGATEVVAALGLQQNLVGISHECDYPPSLGTIPVIVRPRIDSHSLSSAHIDEQVRAHVSSTGTLYELNEQQLLAARPDLIITQNLCDVCAVTPSQLSRVTSALVPPPGVLTLHPSRLADIVQDVVTIGRALHEEGGGIQLATVLRRRLEAVRAAIPPDRTRPKVACLEWLDPLYAAGHWVPDMVEAAGGLDVLATAGTPSQRIGWDRLQASSPDVLVLMPCGFTIERTKTELRLLTDRPEWNRLPAVQRGQVYLADAQAYFNRPGPRLVAGVEQLAAILHPDRFGLELPLSIERLPIAAPVPQ